MITFQNYILHELQYEGRGPIRFSDLGLVFSWPDKFIEEREKLPPDLSWDNTFIVPSELTDDSSEPSSFSRANREVFLKAFDHLEGVYPLIGHFNAAGVAISLKAFDNEEVRQMLEYLQENLCLDKEIASRKEMEMRVEEWNSRIYGDVCSTLRDFEHPFCHSRIHKGLGGYDREETSSRVAYRIEADLEQFFDEAFGKDPDDGDPRPLQMRLFDEALDSLGGNWQEGRTGVYIDLEEEDVATELAYRLTDGDFDHLRTDSREK